MVLHKSPHFPVVWVNSIRQRFCILTSRQLIATLITVLGTTAISYAQDTEVYQDRDQGVLSYRQGNLEAALVRLRRATKALKDDHLAWHYLGLAQYDTGEVKAARKSFERAIKLRPDFAGSHTALAYTLLVAAKVKAAENEAQLALTLDRTDARAHFVVGTILLRKNECDGALTHAEAAQTNDPKLAVPYLLKSQALLCEQITSIVRPVKLEGSVATRSQQEASQAEKFENAKRGAGRFSAAADNLEKYLKLEPNAPEAELWREQLKTLRIYAEPAEKTSSERTVFNGSEVTIKPRVLAKPEPRYTEAARRAQVVGTVVLRVVFAADGSVQHVLIVNSLPYGLTQQAIAVARKIKFIPATRNGQPTSMYIQLEYNFNLY